MLLRAWAAGTDPAVAWVTVERGERDAQRFWLPVIDALATAAGEDVVERVSPAPRFAGAPVVERLLGELDRLQDPLDLVIDDLHELASDDALAWLEMLRHAPAGRSCGSCSPPARSRRSACTACGSRVSSTELRAPDLRFSLDETRALLEATGISAVGSWAAVGARAHGGVAGRRAAGGHLAGHAPGPRPLRGRVLRQRTDRGGLPPRRGARPPAAGGTRAAAAHVDPRARQRLAGRGAHGRAGPRRSCSGWRTQNAFVTALDAARTWFRYHHLFADLLRLELRRVAPAEVPSLHRAAAAWHEEHQDVLEAARHHLAAERWAPAARLLVDNYLALTMDGRGETLHALLREFPPDARLGDLAAALATDCILNGLLDEAADHLHAARRLAAEAPAARRRVFDVYLAVIEVELARRRHDLPKAREALRELEATLSATGGSPVRAEYRALTLMNLGIAELWAGRVEDARQHLEDALGRTPRSSRPFIEVGCLAHLALVALLTGQPLPRALELSERALAIAEEHGWAGQSIADRGVRDGRHRAGATGSLRRRRAPPRARGGNAAHGVRPGNRGRPPARPRHDALRRGQLRRRPDGVRVRAEPGTTLSSEHLFAIEARGRVQVRVRMGATDTRLPACPEQHERAGTRIALAALELDRGNAARCREALAPVIGGSAPALHERTARVEALSSTPRPATVSATGARPRSRSRRHSSWPSPRACSCPSCSGRAASCSSATPGTGRPTRR